MTRLRVGTRGSELALWQTGWVSDRLRTLHPDLTIERIVITTHGDEATDQPLDRDWPVGGFVGAIEQALANHTIDFAVHSYKDLPTAVTAGLIVAAVPQREVVHDLLFTREPVDLDGLRPGFRIATSSPRRAAQLRRLGDVEIVPIRGNVPTRLAKLEREGLDGVVLAAAGVTRLGLNHPHVTALPTDRFVPSPAQGALAVQTRDEPAVVAIVAALDHVESRVRVTAERSFLKTIAAGCHVPVGALATTDGKTITLHGQLFSADGARLAEGIESGAAPVVIGERLARRLMAKLTAC